MVHPMSASLRLAVNPDLERLIAACPAYTSDSRDARAGDLFVALRGTRLDSHEFVPELLASGVSCVVQCGTAARFSDRVAPSWAPGRG